MPAASSPLNLGSSALLFVLVGLSGACANGAEGGPGSASAVSGLGTSAAATSDGSTSDGGESASSSGATTEASASTSTDASASASTTASTTTGDTATTTTTTTSEGSTSDATTASCTPVDPPPLPPYEPADVGSALDGGVLSCVGKLGYATDDRLPADQHYVVTTFGGPGDEQAVSCNAADADGTWYYAANAQRFPCGQKIRLVDDDRSACVIVEVADLGPHLCVEAAAENPVWDVSPLATQELYGISSAGWSEKVGVYGAPVGGDQVLGPCPAPKPATNLAGYIGGACVDAGACTFADASCLDGPEWPGGHCTTPCESGCPDGVGPVAYTACVDLGGGDLECVARCDFTLFADGCRDGYGCVSRPHPMTQALRDVCLPLACE